MRNARTQAAPKNSRSKTPARVRRPIRVAADGAPADDGLDVGMVLVEQAPADALREAAARPPDALLQALERQAAGELAALGVVLPESPNDRLSALGELAGASDMKRVTLAARTLLELSRARLYVAKGDALRAAEAGARAAWAWQANRYLVGLGAGALRVARSNRNLSRKAAVAAQRSAQVRRDRHAKWEQVVRNLKRTHPDWNADAIAREIHENHDGDNPRAIRTIRDRIAGTVAKLDAAQRAFE